ncbi:hypothetical protein A8926_4478 [Saccharopolyspora spinosa]|uniref:Uncharacterized protein n=1 Tax=Saccharopolyspora spinosa TaxID=60894 RepID=A0A2N3Y138_SACSN|nr:hypothetical protein A8926_4478 [Saccharopolyspora spinosa]
MNQRDTDSVPGVALGIGDLFGHGTMVASVATGGRTDLRGIVRPLLGYPGCNLGTRHES